MENHTISMAICPAGQSGWTKGVELAKLAICAVQMRVADRLALEMKIFFHSVSDSGTMVCCLPFFVVKKEIPA